MTADSIANKVTMPTSSPSQWKMMRFRLAVEAQGVVHEEQTFVVAVSILYCIFVYPWIYEYGRLQNHRDYN